MLRLVAWTPKFHVLARSRNEGEICCADPVHPRTVSTKIPLDHLKGITILDHELKIKVQDGLYDLGLCELCQADLVATLISRIPEGI